MNPLTFNDPVLGKFLMPNRRTGQSVRADIIYPETADSPLFIDRDPEYPDLNKGISGDGKVDPFLNDVFENPKLLPFEDFRLNLLPNSVDSALRKAFNFWVHCRNKRLWVVMHPIDHVKTEPFSYVCNGIGWDGSTNQFKFNIALAFGGVLRTEEMPEGYRSDISGMIGSLAMFIHRMTSGTNFIAEVRPDKQGKSVQWTKARTHYVLVHKSHPANAETVKAGEAVAEDAGYIKRQAHSRRAHYRILRSPKFKNKVGQKIRVKACWVGPKEWKQGSSIYVLKA